MNLCNEVKRDVELYHALVFPIGKEMKKYNEAYQEFPNNDYALFSVVSLALFRRI